MLHMEHQEGTSGPPLMTTGQVAETFGVKPRTVTQWARDGKLPSITTPGGRLRYRRSDVESLLDTASEVA
jgi:excisionase family DNA binding protein